MPTGLRHAFDVLICAVGAAAVLHGLLTLSARRRLRSAAARVLALADACNWEELLRQADILDASGRSPAWRWLGSFARARALDGLGESARAVDVAQALTTSAPNEAVCIHVTAGRYAEALEIARAAPASPRGARLTEAQRALIRINAAEALYNTGRWEEAWRELEGLEPQPARPGAAEPDTAAWRLVLDGLWIQRAWILARAGRGDEALEALGRANRGGIPPAYQSETRFARAAALLALRRDEEALAAVQEGLALAQRASSERNGLFLLARIAAARSDWQGAEAHCRRAADHHYRGQGGDGLLLWGEALEHLGRIEDARAAWLLAIARDPQSEAAATAAERLGHVTPSPP